MAEQAGGIERVTVAVAAERLKRSAPVVYGWIKNGLLKKTPAGKVNFADVERLSAERPVRASKKGKPGPKPGKKKRVVRKHSAKKIFEADDKADLKDITKVADLLKVLRPDGYAATEYKDMLVAVHRLATVVEGISEPG